MGTKDPNDKSLHFSLSFFPIVVSNKLIFPFLNFFQERRSSNEANVTKLLPATPTNNESHFEGLLNPGQLIHQPIQNLKNVSEFLVENLLGLPQLFNPREDLQHLGTVAKIVPRLVPYILDNYKNQFAGLVVGISVGQRQLFDIHQSLVDWHRRIQVSSQ